MIDLFLKAPDQASLYAALESAGLMVTDESGARIPAQASHGHALDVIGDLWVDEDGNPANWFKPGVTKLPGCHVNLRLWGANATTIETALASVIIAEPNRAQRVWA